MRESREGAMKSIRTTVQSDSNIDICIHQEMVDDRFRSSDAIT